MEKKTFLVDNKVVFYTGLIYFIIMALFVVLKVLAYFGLFSFSGAGYVYRLIVQIGLMAVLPMCLFSILLKKNAKQTFEFFSFRKITFVSVLVSILLGVCVFVFISYISSLWSGILGFFGYQGSTGTAETDYSVANFFLSIFLVGVLPGFCEEVAHRGMLLNGYKKMGTKKAIILSGFLFGLMHLNIEQFFFASIIGIFFGFVAFFTDSIFPTMIMHFTNNAISTFMGYASANNLPIYDAFNSFIGNMFGGNAFLSIMMMFLFILILVGLMYLIVMAMFKDTRLKNMAKVADKAVKEELRRRLMSGVGGAEEIEKDDDIDVDLKTIGNNKIFSIVLRTGYKNVYKPTFRDNIFLYVNLFLGIATTLSTFIWGVL